MHPRITQTGLLRTAVLLAAVSCATLAVSAVSFAGTAAAPLGFASLNVDIWPEHDDPRLLVIYRGSLNDAASLPRTLTFAIPSSGQVNAAAYRGADGQLYSVDYQYRHEGDRLQVTMTVPERGFQFEYYIDAITGLPQRSFSVDLEFPLPVDALRVSVEQPLRASGFTLAPAAGGTTVTPAGFTHHIYTVGSWPAGRAWSLRASYQKPDANPSLARAGAAPAPQPPRPVAPARPAAGVPVWLWAAAAALGAAGVAIVGLRLGWWRREVPRGGRGARAAGPAPPPPGSGRREKRRRGEVARVYCTSCGARARPGDRFCSRCGHPLDSG